MISKSTTPLTVFKALGDAKCLELCQAAQSDAEVFLLLLKVSSADRVRREDPDFVAGVNRLVSKKLLTNEDKIKLLGA
jgi:hypothetical protein